MFLRRLVSAVPRRFAARLRLPHDCTFRGIEAPSLPTLSVDASDRNGSVQSRESSVTNLSTPLQMTTPDCDSSFAHESMLISIP